MTIARKQLEAWSALGATTSSAATYASIRTALERYAWPPGIAYNCYLQGSYPNHTNIRGDSDVDVVVQTDSVFYSNLSEEKKKFLGLPQGHFTFDDFFGNVFAALRNYYGNGIVARGRKSIKVPAATGRLAADIVPCVAYRNYREYAVAAEGMTFWTTDNVQIINYPRLHLANGSRKNSRCDEFYKPAVRMFKNARNALFASQVTPSYFLECLMYNLSDDCFSVDLESTFYECARELLQHAKDGTLAAFSTGSQQHPLFGNGETQWSIANAKMFIDDIVDLWNGK